ncbi:protein ycf2 [Phtheirospermum japonicum]|uniref:Protein ycf2 n=1 Tax=Phtheirospermum japonicum TaxID=374723 RepID=A0A830BKR2_9LAMI|nr:protein ycf2 [Phtheirospermum japonicum]
MTRTGEDTPYTPILNQKRDSRNGRYIQSINNRAGSGISGREGISTATVGVNGSSSLTVRVVAGISSASDLTVGGRTAVRNLNVEAPISSAGIDEPLGSYPLRRLINKEINFYLIFLYQLCFLMEGIGIWKTRQEFYIITL